MKILGAIVLVAGVVSLSLVLWPAFDQLANPNQTPAEAKRGALLQTIGALLAGGGGLIATPILMADPLTPSGWVVGWLILSVAALSLGLYFAYTLRGKE